MWLALLLQAHHVGAGVAIANPNAVPSSQPPVSPQQPVKTSRLLNEITIPTTHNSYNYSPRFQLPNVHESVAEQLRQGIRALELDIHRRNHEFQLFHKVGGLLGSQPALEVLGDIRTFMAANPEAIITLKLHTQLSADDLQQLFKQAELLSSLYVHAGGPPPSPQTLVKKNQRLLILNAPAPLAAQIPHCVTRWDRKSPAALWPPKEHASPCQGDYLSVVAYAVDLLGTGSTDHAAVINDYDHLLKLAETAWKLNGKKVWRLVVDFPDIGDVYKVAETLNQWAILKGEVRNNGKILPQVSWKNTYSQGNAPEMTTTYGRFSFPMKPGETVTLTPSHPDYTFEPASITVDNQNLRDRIHHFQAVLR